MRKIFPLLLLLLTLALWAPAQNLVPNPGFEIRSGCPSAPGQFRLVDSWISPNNGSPDYFNECSISMDFGTEFNRKGGQPAHGGQGYAGIQSENLNRNEFYEYIQTRLTEPLKAGTEYCIRIFVSRGNSNDALAELGAVLSQTQVKSTNPAKMNLPYVSLKENAPLEDSERWVCLSNLYRAKGGEQYLTIGDFSVADVFVRLAEVPAKDSLFRIAYYFIDDVSVEIADSTVRCRCD
jgi:hypothetical protein